MAKLHVRPFMISGLVAAVLAFATPAHPDTIDLTTWPDAQSLSGVRGELVTFPSYSPFKLWEAGKGDTLDPRLKLAPRCSCPTAPAPRTRPPRSCCGTVRPACSGLAS